MSATQSAVSAVVVEGLDRWFPVGFRAIAVAMLLPAAVLKFVNYESQAAFFAEIGVPAADVTVLLVGAIELLATFALAFGVAGRLAALVVVPIMVTAIVLDGVAPSNVTVLVANLAIIWLGSGTFALWEPQIPLLEQLW